MLNGLRVTVATGKGRQEFFLLPGHTMLAVNKEGQPLRLNIHYVSRALVLYEQ